MKGYPRSIGTKRDFENLLEMDEYREQALADLKALAAIQDDEMAIATKQKNPEDPDSDWETIKTPNPSPIYKQKGFKNKAELKALQLKYTKSEEKQQNGKP